MSHEHHIVFPKTLPTSTTKKTGTQVIRYFGMTVVPAAGTCVVTAGDGTVIDQVTAATGLAGKSWFGPNGIQALEPLTFTITGTVSGSYYVA
jgi:hypothetical protein